MTSCDNHAHEYFQHEGNQYRVLDAESVKDPDTLLLLFNDILSTQRRVVTVTGMMAALLLHQCGEMDAPPDEVYEDTMLLLREWFLSVQQFAREGGIADQVRDLLEAKE